MAHRLDNSKWWIELDIEATLAIAQGTPFTHKAYMLLHETGALMHDERGPIVADSWPNICHMALVNSSFWILSVHDRRVIRVAHGKKGVYADGSHVFIVPHMETFQSLTKNDRVHQEIQHEETGTQKRQRSGAENRRRARERGTKH